MKFSLFSMSTVKYPNWLIFLIVILPSLAYLDYVYIGSTTYLSYLYVCLLEFFIFMGGYMIGYIYKNESRRNIQNTEKFKR